MEEESSNVWIQKRPARRDTPLVGKLYLALELSQVEWKLGFTIGLGQAPRWKSRPGSQPGESEVRDRASQSVVWLAAGGSRVRWIGMVALARKLLITLWRYVYEGILPEGAQLKSV